MVTESTPTDQAPGAICPWCSAALPLNATTCPSCGASLTSAVEPDVPGLTAVDAKAAREKPQRSRSRLLSWISGEYPEQAPAEGETSAIAPPDPEVQREILKLEIQAEVANLQAEADSMVSDAVAEGRVPDLPEGLRPFATMDVAPATPSELDALEQQAATEPEGATATGAPPAADTPAGVAPTDEGPPPA